MKQRSVLTRQKSKLTEKAAPKKYRFSVSALSWDEAEAANEDSFLDIAADLLSGRFLNFYLVPKVKFTVHFAFHIFFVISFSAFLLTEMAEYAAPKVGANEVFIWVWSFARFIGESVEINEFSRQGLYVYARDFWNIQDILFFVLMLVAMSLRLVAWPDPPPDQSFVSIKAMSQAEAQAFVYSPSTLELMPRSIYSFMIIMACVRCLQYLRYYRSVGVLTIVLGHMFADVAFFLILLLLITGGFAVAFSTLLPGRFATSSPMWNFLGDSPFYDPFWSIFGEYDVDLIAGGLGASMPTAIVAPTLLWLYLFVVLVVLVNLLIAQMSDTYARITGEGLLRWQFERAQLITEFKDTKPPLPPPFNVLWFAFVNVPTSWYRWYIAKYYNTVRVGSKGFKLVPVQQELSVLYQREEEAVKRCLQERERRQSEKSEAQMKLLLDGLMKLDAAGRANFESINGRIDELRVVPRVSAPEW